MFFRESTISSQLSPGLEHVIQAVQSEPCVPWAAVIDHESQPEAIRDNPWTWEESLGQGVVGGDDALSTRHDLG